MKPSSFLPSLYSPSINRGHLLKTHISWSNQRNHDSDLLVCERLLCNFLIQLLLKDLELRVGLGKLCLEPGDLMSMLLPLSPAENDPVKLCVCVRAPTRVYSCVQVKVRTAVSAIHSAAHWSGPLWPAGPFWPLTAPAWLPCNAVYCALPQPLPQPTNAHSTWSQPIRML